MRTISVLLAALALAPGASATETEFPAVEHYLNSGVDCSKQAMPDACEGTLETIEADYASAIAGDYQGQRNLAYCLQHSCEGVMQTNPMLACAWRIVILESGHLLATDLDLQSYHGACGVLELPAQRSAISQANRIMIMLAERAELSTETN